MPDLISRADAIAFGFDRYFTGEPCMWGHVAEHYTSNGGCVECARNPTSQCSARELKRRYDYSSATRLKQEAAQRADDSAGIVRRKSSGRRAVD